MFLSVRDGSNTTHIATTNDHGQVAIIKFNVVLNFARFDVHTDGIMGTQHWIRIPNGTTIMGNTIWDTLCTDSHPLHPTQLILKNTQSRTL